MYLYQAFKLRKQLISIFQRLSRIFGEFESTFCLKYFRNIVIVMTKGKNKKIKTTNIYLFLKPPLPSPDSHPPTFLTAKIFEIFFIDTWVSGQRVGKLTVWQS